METQFRVRGRYFSSFDNAKIKMMLPDSWVERTKQWMREMKCIFWLFHHGYARKLHDHQTLNRWLTVETDALTFCFIFLLFSFSIIHYSSVPYLQWTCAHKHMSWCSFSCCSILMSTFLQICQCCCLSSRRKRLLSRLSTLAEILNVFKCNMPVLTPPGFKHILDT